MANVVKDIGEIWTRLFDHRPFLNGEIRFFLQEFEEKRGNTEVHKLLEILQNLTEIRHSQIEKVKLLGEVHLQTLKAKIDAATEKCNNILGKEAIQESNSTSKEKTDYKKVEWEAFNQHMLQEITALNESFRIKENDLYNYYNIKKN